MHAWPQVIGMFGWLIDKVNLRQEPTVYLETLEPCFRQSYQVTQVLQLLHCDSSHVNIISLQK